MHQSALPCSPILKTIAVALVASALLVACGDDEAGVTTKPYDADTPDATLADVAPDLGEDTRAPDSGTDVDAADAADAAGDVEPDAPEVDAVAFDPMALQADTSLFTMGVSAGAMTSDSAILWTFVEEPEPLLLRVWRPLEDRPGFVILDVDQIVDPNEAGYVKVEVELPAGGEWYAYGFFRQGDGVPFARSPLGRFKAALAEGDLSPVTIATESGTRYNNMPYHSLEMAASLEPDAFINLGDMGYYDEATTRDEYRALWHDTLNDEGYEAVMRSMGYYITWDDHEVLNNYNPETIDPDRFDAARDAFFETLPVREGPDRRLWTSFKWGESVEFFIMDCRSERRPSTRDDANAQYISEEQLDWLEQGMLNSTAHFKVLVNSVPITNLPPIWISQADRWQGYPAQRERLIDYILVNNIRNVWFLTGDFHLGFISRVEAQGEGRRLWEISGGPGANGPNPLAIAVELGDMVEGTVFPSNQFEFWSSHYTVATTVTFDPIADNVAIQFVDSPSGDVLYDGVISEWD